MIDYLIQRFLPTVDGGTIREQRKQYGYLSAWIGIVSNLLLCVAKFTIGFIIAYRLVEAYAIFILTIARDVSNQDRDLHRHGFQ